MNITTDRLEVMRAEEKAAGQLGWYFMKFMEGSEYLGAAIIQAYGPVDALLTASEKDADPGRGRVVMTTVAEQHLPAEGFRGRLLTKAEVESFWPEAPEPKAGP